MLKCGAYNFRISNGPFPTVPLCLRMNSKKNHMFLCAGQRVHICDTLPDSFQRATIRLSFRGQAEIKVGSTFLLAELRINF